jgi:hypothetical protein
MPVNVPVVALSAVFLRYATLLIEVIAALLLPMLVAIVADKAVMALLLLPILVAIVEDTVAIRVSSVAEVPALAAAIAIAFTELIASKFVCVRTETAAMAELLLAIDVAIVLDTVAILPSNVADTLAILVANVADTAANSALVGTPDVEITRSPDMLMLVPAVY